MMTTALQRCIELRSARRQDDVIASALWAREGAGPRVTSALPTMHEMHLALLKIMSMLQSSQFDDRGIVQSSRDRNRHLISLD